jgi:PAS domain S-box-containing protein
MGKVKILVVEDGGVIASYIQNMLEEFGYAVPAVTSSQVAVAKTAEIQPDLVLVDVEVERRVDGVEAAEQIRARLDIPVVLLADEKTLQRIQIVQPFECILKPFRERELHCAVEMALYRRGMEKALREREICLRTIYESAMDGIFVVDAQGRYVDVNPAGCRMFGYAREEILGADMRLLLFPEDVERMPSGVQHVWREDAGRSEIRMRRKDGSEIWVQMATASFQVNGRALTLGIKRDVTEHKRAERELDARERFLSLLNDVTRAAIETEDLPDMLQALANRLCESMDADGCYLALWDAAAQTPLSAVAHGEWHPAHSPAGVEPGPVVLAESVMRAGRPLVVEDVSNAPYMGQRVPTSFPYRSLLGLPLTAGDQKLGAALIAFKARHSFAPDQVARGEQAASQIALAVAKTRLLEQVRRQVEELISLNRVGRAVTSSLDLNQVLTTVMQEARELLQAEAASVLLLDEESGELVFETAVGLGAEKAKGLRLPPGQGIAGWVIRESRPLLVPDVNQTDRFYPDIDVITGLDTRSILAVPLRVKERAVGAIEAVNKIGASFTPADEELLSSMAQSAAIAVENARLYQDLHDRMEELKRTQAQLVQSAKLAAVGRLAAGVAHEINSPLTGVVGLTQLLLEDMDGRSPIKQDLQAIKCEADRIRTIVKALLDFAGQQAEPQPEARDVNAIVQSTIGLVFYQARKAGIRVKESYDPSLPPVWVDAEQVGQAFLHIVTNAIQAMPEGGELKVGTARRTGALNGADCVAVEFHDTGAGISPEHLPYIFDPFFTTREVGQGMGLGLTVSHGIVQSHGGKIEVESELGQGSTFTVLLPVSEAKGDA